MSAPKLSYSVDELADASGLSDWTIRQAIKDNYLTAHWSGRKQIILAADATSWLEALPTERVL